MNSLPAAPLPPPPPPHPSRLFVRVATVGAVAAAAAGVALNVTWSSKQQWQKQHPFASMSQMQQQLEREPTTGTDFPALIQQKQELMGLGLRKKSVLGLKSIVVYAYGVYVDASSAREKLGSPSCEAHQILEDVACKDVEMCVRLRIVYGSLKMASVRSAFEESVGSRILKFKGSEDKELLNSFTSLFKDEIKLPKGTTIDLVRLPGHVLRTTINEQEVGSVHSELLCRCVLDLYIGQDAFDKAARQTIAKSLTAALA